MCSILLLPTEHTQKKKKSISFDENVEKFNLNLILFRLCQRTLTETDENVIGAVLCSFLDICKYRHFSQMQHEKLKLKLKLINNDITK